MILSLVKVEGGVGKTTTAVNLAATFAANDLRVLLGGEVVRRARSVMASLVS